MRKLVPAISTLTIAMLLTLGMWWFTGPQTCAAEQPAAVWSKTYGGPDLDQAKSVLQTIDGGFAMAGYTNSFGAGSYDAWLVKVDELGNMECMHGKEYVTVCQCMHMS